MPPTMRPVIGITAYVERARWGVWDQTATLVPHRYVERVHAAGGRAVVVPPFGTGAARLVRALDGLVLAGGPDVDPARYGAPAQPETTDLRPERDAGELELLRSAVDAGLPVLGICRGMQLMAVAYGGTLHQHLPDLVGHDRHCPAAASYGRHPVRTVAGTRLADLLGAEVVVPSHHHQGVADPGKLTVSAYAADEIVDVVEAVELTGDQLLLGVLWHPEVGDDPRLFDALVAAARDTPPPTSWDGPPGRAARVAP